MTQHFDLLFTQARVIDGSGAAGFVADVGVSGERIVAIGDLSANTAKQTIDAHRKVLAPGFIDAHTHDDRALLAYPDMTAKVSQGVTSVITGNCGISIAPLENKKPVPPLNLLGEQTEWRFADFDAYAETLDKTPAAVNSKMLIGHSTLRVGAMEELERAATTAEIDCMCQALSKALQSGAAGMSTGLAYPPAMHAPTSEVIELARVLKQHGGVHTTHMRDEENDVVASVEETLFIGLQADVPVVISHHKACGRPNWGRTRETLEIIQQARQHQCVTCDVYPYTASSTVLLAAFVTRAERVMITWSEALPQFAKWDLQDIAIELSCDLFEAVELLQPAGAIYFQMSEDDLQRVLSFDGVMVGSDGLPHDPHPHPRLWGTFPRVLGHYSRDEKLFPLEQAIERMTGNTATVFGMVERGFIRPDYYADLVLFDPETVIDLATYDEPDTTSTGIELVMVNGEITFQDGQSTGSRSGRLLLD